MIKGENFVIEETIISIPSDKLGWNIEVNKVSWYGREASYEIRKWNEDHSKSGKGVTLSEDEIVLLFQRSKEILEKITGEVIKDETEEKKEVEESNLPFE